MTSCLFCTAPSPPAKNVETCVTKTEVFITADDPPDCDYFPNFSRLSDKPFPPLLFGEDSLIQEQLKAFLILKNILKIPQETLRRFLQQNDGEFEPASWLNLCSPCADSVAQFFETLKQISKLERKLVGIESELKGKIQSSKEVASGSPVAEQIRTCVLYGYSIPDPILERDGGDHDHQHSQLEVDQTQSYSEYESEQTPANAMNEEFEAPYYPVNEEWTAVTTTLSTNYDEHSALFLDVNDLDGNFEPPPLPQKLKLPTTFKRKREEVRFKKFKTKDKEKHYSYKCDDCPYVSTNIHRYKIHLKNHQEGSGAVTCHKCGWCVRQMSHHLAKAHKEAKKIRKAKPGVQESLTLTYVQCPEFSNNGELS